jgi:hypothetical protein
MTVPGPMRLGALFLVPVLAIVAFGVTRELAHGGKANADAPNFGPTPPAGNQTPFGLVPAQQTRAAQPRYDQTINGITVGPTASRRGGPCQGVAGGSGNIQTRPYSDAATSQLAIDPKYLPDNTVEDKSIDFSNAVYCNNQLASTQRHFEVPPDRSAPRYGGFLIIARFFGEPLARVDLPAQDFAPGFVAGRKAVMVRPTTDDGSGDSTIVVLEPWGLTVLSAHGITLQELQRVAEGLY